MKRSEQWSQLKAPAVENILIRWLGCANPKGSRKNKFTFSSVAAPAWQGAKAQEYQDISSFRNAAGQDELAHKNVKLFFREP
jgi:hypothetical protein